MRVAVSGSIATDYLMTFPGRFTQQLLPDRLDVLSLSFLVDELEIRRGGVAANICYGLAQFGLRPLLIGAAGRDFDAYYRSWLERHGVDCSGVHLSELRHTARFLCTSDADQNQVASFYAGAMQEARNIELSPLLGRIDDEVLVVVSANDPEAMLRHADECRQSGVAFLADPGQQLARLDGSAIRTFVAGADTLVTNEYERTLLESKTGWGSQEILAQVGVLITTLGPRGVLLESSASEPVLVSAAQERARVDPTGVGDGFRAGYLAGLAWGMTRERSAQLGSMVATLVLEHVGTQEYDIVPIDFLRRFEAAYGADASFDLERHLAPLTLAAS